jgi:hypothetical protein
VLLRLSWQQFPELIVTGTGQFIPQSFIDRDLHHLVPTQNGIQV